MHQHGQRSQCNELSFASGLHDGDKRCECLPPKVYYATTKDGLERAVKAEGNGRNGQPIPGTESCLCGLTEALGGRPQRSPVLAKCLVV